MQFKLAAIAAVAVFFQTGAAHMIMDHPRQWANHGFNSNPLAADGSDFPCQGGTPDAQASATFTAGQSANLEVLGSATHGGGSGQISITYDYPPTRNSVWRVMQSFQGDHPVKTDGNFPADPLMKHPPIGFQVPSGLPSGRAILAWTWFNRIGNREMYMKCATVQIQGSQPTGGNLNQEPGVLALPTMFRANSGNGCTVPEGVNAIAFKNPGQNVVRAPYTAQAIGCDSTQAGSGSGSPPTTTPPQGGGDESAPGGGDEEVPPTIPTIPTTPTTPTTPDNGSAPAEGSACSPEGKVYCNSGTTWSQCGSGRVWFMGGVPGGTTCRSGVFVLNKKRSIRFSREHMRHRH